MDRLDKVCEDLKDIEIKYRNKLDLSKQIKFGTEIEFENASYHDVSMALQSKKKLSKWLLKGDPSVVSIYNGVDHGGELISPILHDAKVSWSELKAACLLIRNNLGLNLGHSGAHIHIDSSILKDNDEFILNLVKIWTIYEHVIYRFAYGDETDKPRLILTTYAYPVAPYYNEFLITYYDDANAFHYVLNNIKINKQSKLYYLLSMCASNLNALNSGLNFNHCKGLNEDEKNTIEIRCPNGTLNHLVWQNNINFFTKLLLYCTSSDFDREFIERKLQSYEYRRLEKYSDIYLKDAIELSNLIFDNELDKMYFLKQYLKINKYNFETIKEKALKR